MTTDEIIAVVQAYKDGKAIQVDDSDWDNLGWRDCPGPSWNFDRFKYRVKPEPREWWVLVPKASGWATGVFYETEKAAEEARRRSVYPSAYDMVHACTTYTMESLDEAVDAALKEERGAE